MKKSLTALLASMVATNAFAMVGDIQINGFLSAAVAWSTVDYLNTGVEPIYVSYIGRGRAGIKIPTSGSN
ncbi:MAG TPA: hypothetical protein PLD88_08275 [Candidatus Berkiella sp.]|nr:hypothetical protein [Candidatus Berkiella sp.]